MENIMTNENETNEAASEIIANEIAAAISNGTDEVLTAAEGPKPRKSKAKGGPSKTSSEHNEENKPKEGSEPATMPPAVNEIDGFALKDGTDATVVRNALIAAQVAAEKINRKDADLLSAYLEIGALASEIAPAFKSLKVYGQALAKLVPASAALDPALRSNCKWLHEALNASDSDLLVTLKVNRLEDYKSANPTVIRREYKAIKDAVKAEAEAQENGMTVEEMEKAEKAKKEAAANREAEMVKVAIDGIAAAVAEGKAVKSLSVKLREVLTTVFVSSKRSDMITVLYDAFGPKPEADDEDGH